MVSLDPMKGMIAQYLATPRGQEMIHGYLSSPEGQATIRDYLATPRGRKTARNILPLVLDAVDLPCDIKNSIRENPGKRN